MSGAERAISALIALMARLRDPNGGCPWDREQTFASIAPYTIEEAYEVADAIEHGSPDKLRDELGDLLFQVVFHARMAEERGWFDFAAVAGSIHDKLVRRHPHVFAGASVAGAEEQTRAWEELKARERAEASQRHEGGDAGTLADVPRALPALTRAGKLGRRASRVGFDWDSAPQVREKVAEELAETDEAVSACAAQDSKGEALGGPVAQDSKGEALGGPVARDSKGAALDGPAARDSEHVKEELGDLLFALANWGRHLGVDAEEALRGANGKFESRFRIMEALASAQGRALESFTATEWEALWAQAKKRAAGPQR
jgi:nucleoside triphosphate diphosphatase